MVKQIPVETEPRGDKELVNLGDRRVDANQVGSKAANLSRLIERGFTVPPGVVLPVKHFNSFLEINRFDHDTSAIDAREGVFPESVEALIDTILEQLGQGPLAVRSSANDEDLPDASYAGLYDSVLDVYRAEGLREAIMRCWASAFNERVREYRRQQRQPGVPGIAIIVQQLVEADAAGVAFTMNPISGDRNEVLVSAVRGLGERLVSGLASPDEWVVREGQARQSSGREHAIDARQAVRIAVEARKVEQAFGAPQDVEWAIAGDDLFLLQSRPVTTATQSQPVKPAIKIPDGFWRRDSAHYPKPMSPMARSFYLDNLERSVTEAFQEYGILLDGIQAREIGGYIYLRTVPPGGKEGPAPPWWLLGILARLHPGLRAVIKRARNASRNDLGNRLISRWWSSWRNDLMQQVSDVKRVDLASLTDSELDDEITRRLTLLEEGNLIHFRLFPPFMTSVAELVFFARDHLGWDTRRSMELLSGLSGMSTEPSRRLAILADQVKQRPALADALNADNGPTLESLHAVDSEFARKLESYLDEFGPRLLGEDLIEPTLGERPEITLAMLRGQIASPGDPDAIARELADRREAVASDARLQLNDRPAQLRRFEHLLERAANAYPVREDNSFATYQAPMGLLRLAILELGNRLAERGLIDARDDVMYLELEEGRAGLAGARALADIVERRKGEHIWALQNPGPSHYGQDPGPPPDMRALPDEVRTLMESLLWFIENDIEARPVEGDGIQGIGASPGNYTGPVRVIRDEREFHRLQPGDVLVCPITSPVWSVLFANTGALVTDTGGILSHSAIIAREYGIPAVVATVRGTTELRDGQMVTVDGAAGTVRIEA